MEVTESRNECVNARGEDGSARVRDRGGGCCCCCCCQDEALKGTDAQSTRTQRGWMDRWITERRRGDLPDVVYTAPLREYTKPWSLHSSRWLFLYSSVLLLSAVTASDPTGAGTCAAEVRSRGQISSIFNTRMKRSRTV
ncbi:hypothetical protein NQD34_015667 [Periophthalmus magnuspinnatus]|nr:hypothetical protein NQD34_015667 [Periophthalmus magnuspinnatus]